VPFEGIVLTDTFQLGESGAADKLFSEMFPQNSARVVRQKKAPVRVIIGNPPYSVGQKSANDNAQNQKYERLEARIAATYAKETDATNKNSLYDSYIKAFRWSTDRLDPEHGGMIAFVSNGAWLDGNSADGFRKTLEKEFSSIWVFNLRGNARTSGELRQKEAGNVFGSGSRTPIAITLLVRNPKAKSEKAIIRYHDIGDYHSREEKLEIIRRFRSATNPEMPWKQLHPNEAGDWISQRNDLFKTFIPIESEEKFDIKAKSFFVVNSRGIETTRDAWVYNSSKGVLKQNVGLMIDFYNSEVDRFQKAIKRKSINDVIGFLDKDPTKISWSSSLIPKLVKGEKAIMEKNKIDESVYRPFFKQYLYTGKKFIHRRGQFDDFFPEKNTENIIICVSGIGGSKGFSAFISDKPVDVQLQFNGQCFPMYYFSVPNSLDADLFSQSQNGGSTKHDAISDYILSRLKTLYKSNIDKNDIFYYVYGILNSSFFKESFGSDLNKSLPRIPLVGSAQDFWSFSKAGRALADLHINYEKVPAYKGVKVEGLRSGDYAVEKMRFPQKGQKDTILYNNSITIRDIPEKAYEYVVNGRSAIEWVMERYQVTVHKDSGIVNDPNDWAKESGNPRYILDLLLSVINVSMQTVEIVEGLPRLKFGDL